MTDEEIFAGLDDQPWTEIEHCFGPAVDTPGYLRNLRSASESDRGEAQSELAQSIYHLGSRYPATRLAVPFLIRLAIAPDTPERDGIIEFLISLAIGCDTDHFPGGFDPGAQRQRLEDLRAHTPESWEQHLDDWVAAARSETRRQQRERHRPHYTLAGAVEGTESELLAYETVRAGVPALRQLVHAEDPRVRAATAYLLAWFPEDGAESTAALTALLPHESERSVTINALIALGLLPDTPRAVLVSHLSSNDEPIAWAAAAGLVAADAVDGMVVAKLGDALRSDPSDRFGLLYRYGEFPSLASKSLASITGEMIPLAIDTAISAFTEDSRTTMWAAAPAAAALAFPEPTRGVRSRFADLDDRHQRVLRALVDAGPEAWRLNNQLDLLLRPHGLPGHYDDLRIYVEGGE